MYRGKQSKKGNNLQYIHRFMYIFIYIYLYSNFCSVSCCFWTTILLFYFSHVNLQLKVEGNDEEVAGILLCVVVLLLPLPHGNTRAGWTTWVIAQTNHWKSTNRFNPYFFNFLRAARGSQRAQCGDQAHQTRDI